MKLGQKVKCKGYLKKVKVKYVVPENQKEEFIVENCTNDDIIIFKNDDAELSIEQKTRSFIKKEFTGIVVSKHLISTENSYCFASLMYDDDYNYDKISVTKDENIQCYKVCYELNHSRLVPINKCEEDNNE